MCQFSLPIFMWPNFNQKLPSIFCVTFRNTSRWSKKGHTTKTRLCVQVYHFQFFDFFHNYFTVVLVFVRVFMYILASKTNKMTNTTNQKQRIRSIDNNWKLHTLAHTKISFYFRVSARTLFKQQWLALYSFCTVVFIFWKAQDRNWGSHKILKFWHIPAWLTS